MIEGKETYPDGSEYTGFFRNFKRHGNGVLKIDGEMVYEGEWENDEMKESPDLGTMGFLL